MVDWISVFQTGGWMAILALSGCADHSPSVGSVTYRQYAHALAHGRGNAADRQTEQASRGDAGAIHACFGRAVARMQCPFVLAGEDIEELDAEMEFLFYSLGDRRFAEALLREPVPTRNAVRAFLGLGRLEGAVTRTEAVFAATPQVDFPADVATRKDAARS